MSSCGSNGVGLRAWQLALRNNRQKPDFFLGGTKTKSVPQKKDGQASTSAKKGVKRKRGRPRTVEEGAETKRPLKSMVSHTLKSMVSHTSSSQAGSQKGEKRCKADLMVIEEGDPIPDEHEPMYGRVVWAPFGSFHRYYPALVIRGSMVNLTTADTTQAFVFWFSDGKVSAVPREKVLDFVSFFKEKGAVSHGKQQQRGVLKAIEELQRRAGGGSLSLTDRDPLHWAQSGFPMENSSGRHRLNPGSGQCSGHHWLNPGPDFQFSEAVLERLAAIGAEIRLKASQKDRDMPNEFHQESAIAAVWQGAKCIADVCIGCADCDRQVVCQHPLFEGGVCLKCKELLQETFYAIGDDGTHSFCAVCGGGGQLFVCDTPHCGKVYCVPCVEELGGEDVLKKVKEAKKWPCFLCQGFKVSSHGLLKPHPNWQERLILFFDMGHRTTVVPELDYFKIRRPIRVLSLFDGIGTGLLALQKARLEVEVYYASENDEQAAIVSQANHGQLITQLGDVITITKDRLADIVPIDLLIGGSPCNDLSLANPFRKGFDVEGSGVLFFDFYRILRDLVALNGNTHLFWMFENVASMRTAYRTVISRFLQCEPAVWDARHLSAQKRSRFFWGNIPGLYSTPEVSEALRQETDLNSVLTKQCDRQATVRHVRTITTQSNSLLQGAEHSSLPVNMAGAQDTLWLTELERLFGFPAHYTDVSNLPPTKRRALLGRSWSVQVVTQILRPLTQYFATETEQVSSEKDASDSSARLEEHAAGSTPTSVPESVPALSIFSSGRISRTEDIAEDSVAALGSSNEDVKHCSNTGSKNKVVDVKPVDVFMADSDHDGEDNELCVAGSRDADVSSHIGGEIKVAVDNSQSVDVSVSSFRDATRSPDGANRMAVPSPGNKKAGELGTIHGNTEGKCKDKGKPDAYDRDTDLAMVMKHRAASGADGEVTDMTMGTKHRSTHSNDVEATDIIISGTSRVDGEGTDVTMGTKHRSTHSNDVEATDITISGTSRVDGEGTDVTMGTKHRSTHSNDVEATDITISGTSRVDGEGTDVTTVTKHSGVNSADRKDTDLAISKEDGKADKFDGQDTDSASKDTRKTTDLFVGIANKSTEHFAMPVSKAIKHSDISSAKIGKDVDAFVVKAEKHSDFFGAKASEDTDTSVTRANNGIFVSESFKDTDDNLAVGTNSSSFETGTDVSVVRETKDTGIEGGDTEPASGASCDKRKCVGHDAFMDSKPCTGPGLPPIHTSQGLKGLVSVHDMSDSFATNICTKADTVVVTVASHVDWIDEPAVDADTGTQATCNVRGGSQEFSCSGAPAQHSEKDDGTFTTSSEIFEVPNVKIVPENMPPSVLLEFPAEECKEPENDNQDDGQFLNNCNDGAVMQGDSNDISQVLCSNDTVVILEVADNSIFHENDIIVETSTDTLSPAVMYFDALADHGYQSFLPDNSELFPQNWNESEHSEGPQDPVIVNVHGLHGRNACVAEMAKGEDSSCPKVTTALGPEHAHTELTHSDRSLVCAEELGEELEQELNLQSEREGRKVSVGSKHTNSTTQTVRKREQTAHCTHTSTSDGTETPAAWHALVGDTVSEGSCVLRDRKQSSMVSQDTTGSSQQSVSTQKAAGNDSPCHLELTNGLLQNRIDCAAVKAPACHHPGKEEDQSSACKHRSPPSQASAVEGQSSMPLMEDLAGTTLQEDARTCEYCRTDTASCAVQQNEGEKCKPLQSEQRGNLQEHCQINENGVQRDKDSCDQEHTTGAESKQILSPTSFECQQNESDFKTERDSSLSSSPSLQGCSGAERCSADTLNDTAVPDLEPSAVTEETCVPEKRLTRSAARAKAEEQKGVCRHSTKTRKRARSAQSDIESPADVKESHQACQKKDRVCTHDEGAKTQQTRKGDTVSIMTAKTGLPDVRTALNINPQTARNKNYKKMMADREQTGTWSSLCDSNEVGMVDTSASVTTQMSPSCGTHDQTQQHGTASDHCSRNLSESYSSERLTQRKITTRHSGHQRSKRSSSRSSPEISTEQQTSSSAQPRISFDLCHSGSDSSCMRRSNVLQRRSERLSARHSQSEAAKPGVCLKLASSFSKMHISRGASNLTKNF